MPGRRLPRIVVLLCAGGAALTGCDAVPSPFAQTVPPPSIRLDDADARVTELVEQVSGRPSTTSIDAATRLGCNTGDAGESVGPPYRIRKEWMVDDPDGALVSATLTRAAGLTRQDFHRQPWTRPDPEPPGSATYRDAVDYAVTVRAATLPSGKYVLSVVATSPCAA
ncbi:hypothetical protein [Gordonia neofelifaecis]|uniref:Lipoprotein n=1 Tax=Gordonia neofelifaecis NRRL B-59395 TaxID=644548 RepID=F1YM31_9ACTN|nr:hypothetical protein [Gordonia neofelifaecis]EGD54282.1 hypothetical protein SCNU_14876 [Gordonia neofelifaecis NRRL B-59395]